MDSVGLMRGKEMDTGFESPKHSLLATARQLMNNLFCPFSPQGLNGYRRYSLAFDLHPSTEYSPSSENWCLRLQSFSVSRTLGPDLYYPGLCLLHVTAGHLLPR